MEMHDKNFLKLFGTVLIFAIFGTVLSFVITGQLLYIASYYNMFNLVL